MADAFGAGAVASAASLVSLLGRSINAIAQFVSAARKVDPAVLEMWTELTGLQQTLSTARSDILEPQNSYAHLWTEYEEVWSLLDASILDCRDLIHRLEFGIQHVPPPPTPDSENGSIGGSPTGLRRAQSLVRLNFKTNEVKEFRAQAQLYKLNIQFALHLLTFASTAAMPYPTDDQDRLLQTQLEHMGSMINQLQTATLEAGAPGVPAAIHTTTAINDSHRLMNIAFRTMSAAGIAVNNFSGSTSNISAPSEASLEETSRKAILSSLSVLEAKSLLSRDFVARAMSDSSYLTAARDSKTLQRALNLACRTGDVEAIEMLLSVGANRDWCLMFTPEHLSMTPLMEAAANGRPAALQALLDAGADFTISTPFSRDHGFEFKPQRLWTDCPSSDEINSCTVFTVAALTGNSDILITLVKNISRTNRFDLAALWHAIMFSTWNGKTDAVKALLDVGAPVSNPHPATSQIFSVAHLASLQRDEPTLKMMSKHARAPEIFEIQGDMRLGQFHLTGNALNSMLFTYMCQADEFSTYQPLPREAQDLARAIEIIKYVTDAAETLRWAVSLPMRPRNPLHSGYFLNRAFIAAKLLLEGGGINVNAADAQGRTALHVIALKCTGLLDKHQPTLLSCDILLSLIRELVDHGADCTLRDNELGLTAAEIVATKLQGIPKWRKLDLWNSRLRDAKRILQTRQKAQGAEMQLMRTASG